MYEELRKEAGVTKFDLKNNEERLLWIREKVKEYFGIKSVLIFYEGHRIDDEKGETTYCTIVQKDSLNARKCRVSTCLAEIKTLSSLRAMMYMCHGGLINFTIPVIDKKEVIGVLLCGTFRPEDNETAVAVKKISDDFTPLGKNNKRLKLFAKEEAMGYSALGLLMNTINRFVVGIMDGTVDEDEIPFRLNGDNRINRAINKSLEYIYRNIEKNIKLDQVAEAAGLSTFYFCKIFKKTVGIGFAQYLRVAKVEKAKELLQEDSVKIYEVSEMLGFNENNYFARVFRETTGMTPREYRRERRKLTKQHA